MRSLRFWCLLTWALSGIYLAAQNNEYPGNSLVNQGYPILPPIVRTPIVSLSDHNTYDENHGQAPDVYWSVRSTQPPSFPAFPLLTVHSAESAIEPTVTIFNTGVTGLANLDDGIGVSLAEYAAYRKAHTPRATHVYTNLDVERLKNDRH